LHPDTPEQGISLEELFQKKKMDVDVDRVMAHLKKTAAAEGLAMGDRRKTYNSRLAQEAGLWAQSLGKGHAFHTAAFHTYFVEGRNIAKKDVVLDLIGAAGLDPAAGEKVIDERTFSGAVDADWALSRQKQVTAVPTFIMGLEKLVGAQPYPVLEKMVSRNMG
jgi:predicted DsbA family dithiol-disulfide isomerase